MKLSKDDRLWATLVKEREGWCCQRCGTRHAVGSRGMNAHHVFTRSRRNTRHMLSNGVALCVGCHRWVHANPWDAEPFLRRIVPDFDDLQQLSRVLKKRSAIGKAICGRCGHSEWAHAPDEPTDHAECSECDCPAFIDAEVEIA